MSEARMAQKGGLRSFEAGAKDGGEAQGAGVPRCLGERVKST